MKDPLLPPPNSKKTEFGGEEAVFSPPFSFFENGRDTEGVNFSPKTKLQQKKYFILEFQVIYY